MDLQRSSRIWFNQYSINWYSLKLRILNSPLIALSICWVIEWYYIIGILCGENLRIHTMWLSRIPFVLIGCLVYWLYLWIIAVWRRAVFGHFTRGERILWANGYTAFWVAELVTLLSFIIIFVWLSWGLPVVKGSQFITSRSGLLLEFVVYSYLFIFIYWGRLALQWSHIRLQWNIYLISLIILSYLLWHDVLILWGRENWGGGIGSSWRHIDIGRVFYTLSHEWWVEHIIGRRASNSLYGSLLTSIGDNTTPFKSLIALNEYEGDHWHQVISAPTYIFYNLDSNDSFWLHNMLHSSTGGGLTYPRNIGFIPKRLAFWQLLTLLNIWHQLLIWAWYLLALVRLARYGAQTFTLASTCAFNIYCCFIIVWLIYLLNFTYVYEIWGSGTLYNVGLNRHWLLIWQAMNYMVSGLISSGSYYSYIWYAIAVSCVVVHYAYSWEAW